MYAVITIARDVGLSLIGPPCTILLMDAPEKFSLFQVKAQDQTGLLDRLFTPLNKEMNKDACQQRETLLGDDKFQCVVSVKPG